MKQKGHWDGVVQMSKKDGSCSSLEREPRSDSHEEISRDGLHCWRHRYQCRDEESSVVCALTL